MKKIIALVIAIVMMAAISVPAFAHQTAGEHTDVAAPADTEVTAKYVLNESWSVSVPASDITVGENDVAITITAASIDWDRKVEVKVESDWELANVDTGLVDAPTITYKATLGGADVADDTVLASAQAEDLDTMTITNGTVSFELVDDVVVAGDYSDTLTFKVSVATIDARVA